MVRFCIYFFAFTKCLIDSTPSKRREVLLQVCLLEVQSYWPPSTSHFSRPPHGELWTLHPVTDKYTTKLLDAALV